MRMTRDSKLWSKKLWSRKRNLQVPLLVVDPILNIKIDIMVHKEEAKEVVEAVIEVAVATTDTKTLALSTTSARRASERHQLKSEETGPCSKNSARIN